MMFNYKLIFFLYLPILLLSILCPLKDRYDPQNRILKWNDLPLTPSIIILTFMLSNFLIQSFWFGNPIWGYQYNQFGWEIVVLFWNLMILIVMFILLKYVYRTSLIKTFNLRELHFLSILKICGVLSVIYVLCVHLVGLDISHGFQEKDLDIIRSMTLSHLVLFSLNTILIVPPVEEAIFRGLLYAPLYRKLGRGAAMFLTSILFAHSHFGMIFQSVLGTMVIFMKGLLLVWIYDKKGSLIYPLIVHIFLNFWFMYGQLALVYA